MSLKSYVARQPILDRDLNEAFYELLYREQPTRLGRQVEAEEQDAATCDLLVNSLMDIGLDTLAPDHPVLVNVTREHLLRDWHLILDETRIGFELLEDCIVDGALVDAVRSVVRHGFIVALDDFRYDPSYDPLLNLVHLVKVDVLAMDETEVAELVTILKRFPVRLLAEKVETHEQLAFCRSLGFDYFQGFFFTEPELIYGSGLKPTQISKLRLLAEVHNPDITVDDLEQIIDQDVALSYRLLRYVNSAFFGLPRRLATIREAVIYLGLRNMRIWVSMLVVAQAESGTDALKHTALLRARFCQKLAERVYDDAKSGSYFTVGLFSTLDALVGLPMRDILQRLPLSDELNAAIGEEQGQEGKCLRFARALEQGRWDVCDEERLPRKLVRDTYIEALKWTDEIFRMVV